MDIYTANIFFYLRQLGNNLPYPSADYPNIKVFYPYKLTDKIFKEIGKKYAWDFAPYRISREHDGLFVYSMWQGYRDNSYQQNFENS